MLLKKKQRNYLVLLSLSVLASISMALWLSLSQRGNYKMPVPTHVTLANALFSETKDVEDAKNIASVILNRTARPERFGGTIEEVIYQPKQFSGVNSPEWNKAASQKFTEKEAEIYKEMLQVAYQAVTGKLEDKTGGADHYFNPKIVVPKWAAKMKKTTQNKNHSYYKE
jgi:hypothetical protein